MKKSYLLITICISLMVQPVFAANKKLTITGTLDINAKGDNTFLNANDGNQYYFESQSKVGKKIWKVCERNVPCTVSGTVDKNDTIVSVSAVKKGN